MPTIINPNDQLNFVRELLGKPWILNEQDPTKGFDCWSLVRYIQYEVFDRILPIVHIEEDTPRGYIRAVMQGEVLTEINWTKIEKPIHGCVVEMSRGPVPHHVGVYFNLPEVKLHGLVHTLKGAGVLYDPYVTLKAAGWRSLTFNVPRNP